MLKLVMKIYDISFPVSAEVPVYEGDPRVEIDVAASIARGDAANVTSVSMGAHTATPVDAPLSRERERRTSSIWKN
jgi:kynurenine formamidase